jgi:ketosteroid isomerase-like protein
VSKGVLVGQTTDSESFDARDFIERYYASAWELAKGDVDSLREWEVEDIDYQLPWSERLKGFTGVEEHAKVIRFLRDNLKNYEIRVTAFHETVDPNRVIVEATGGGETLSGKDYRNDYVQFITFRDGKIAQVREYFNTLAARSPTD